MFVLSAWKLSLIPRTQAKVPVTVVHICDPNTREGVQEELWGSWPASLAKPVRPRLNLKNEVRGRNSERLSS